MGRRIDQLLNELRNTLLGVQVLLAGMVGVAFTPTLGQKPTQVRIAYGIAFLSAAGAAALLITPTQYHRIVHHHRPSDATLRVGRRCGTTGSAFLALAVVAIVFAVIRSVFPPLLAITSAIAVAIATVALWFAVPQLARRRARPSQR